MTITAQFIDAQLTIGTVQVDPWEWTYDGNYDSINTYFERIDAGIIRPAEPTGDAEPLDASNTQVLTETMRGLRYVDGFLTWEYEDGFEPVGI